MGSINGEEVMQGSNGQGEKILVSVRLRPLNEKEIARNDVSDWECINDNTIIYRNNLSVSERSMFPTAYTFDRVFRHDCSTRLVYEEGAKEVALSVVSGINSSVFAYGQTSSGKTYTMSGITEYTVADIYNYIEKHKEREFILKFSALEIYNESVRDLLSSDSTPLRLLDDPERGTVVEKLTEETLRDWGHFKELLSVCEAQRQIGETSLNEASSRSHQILRLTIESSAREFLGNDKSSSLAATVNFIDLAGSERASQTQSAGTRLKEGCHINRSLLTLGTVIRKLSKGRNGHVPFRDSKLTRILQSSLGGNARTAIICTVSPARSHVEQSRNTLLFASCAKEVATNAQVNLVVSDKALVKKLQRELARLENELRNPGSTSLTSDSVALMKEKELQIEKLQKEVTELTMQRDLAQSQIKDLLRVVGDDMPFIELASLDPHYPKLRVRSSSDFENQTSEAPILSSAHGMARVKSFNASQYSDGYSRSSSGDNLFQLPDFEENLLLKSSSPRLSARVLKVARSDLCQEKIEEEKDEDIEDICRVVRCIEKEVVTTKSNISDFSPNRYTDSTMSSPGGNTPTSGLTVVENGDKESQVLGSPDLAEDKQFNNFCQVLVVPSPNKISPGLSESNTSSSRGLKFTRSRSCKASLMRNLSSNWFEEVEKIENTPPFWFEKHFTGRPDCFQKELSKFKYNSNAEKLSRNGSQNSEQRGATADELKGQNVENPIDKETDENGTLDTRRKGMSCLQSENQLVDQKVSETGLNPIKSAKSVKDVGLDPMLTYEESSLKWSSEFKRLQREIIELWHACNVSLVHRTYFFLLFKGDPQDSIYMEVELRRLTFLKQTFSQGNQTVEDGRTLTPASSMRNLRRERLMLSKKMQKKLSRADRHNLYLKWGIKMSSRHRGFQLAHRMWTDTKDMDHIADSAAIVAKLVGSVKPEQAYKEMFGLNFAPRRTSRKSLGWTSSMKHLL
ncbi:Kinesin-like protein [Quillaja saponaria]|uniref:Kinesin-like protein n=1 Tax=Quillaja saponaria TaxID=32244 RepID=A0AAD7L7X4_QUISA|nr:Kinesin-like protein [Quillaja saponaria]KAJ7953095.1 Kinesin-like protein [Quillaja saponaria]